jgi:tRNA-specific 2-thiouridylase
LGIAKGHPLYVIDIIKDKNAIVVGEKEDLCQDELIASNINWIVKNPPKKPIFY